MECLKQWPFIDKKSPIKSTVFFGNQVDTFFSWHVDLALFIASPYLCFFFLIWCEILQKFIQTSNKIMRVHYNTAWILFKNRMNFYQYFVVTYQNKLNVNKFISSYISYFYRSDWIIFRSLLHAVMHFDRVLTINRKWISRGKSKMRTVQRVITGEKYHKGWNKKNDLFL